MPRRILKTTQVDVAPSRLRLFELPAAWKRSKKGNLWREWDGRTLTIFETEVGLFRWCIAGAGGTTRFATEWYKSEDEAMANLAIALGMWDEALVDGPFDVRECC